MTEGISHSGCKPAGKWDRMYPDISCMGRHGWGDHLAGCIAISHRPAGLKERQHAKGAMGGRGCVKGHTRRPQCGQQREDEVVQEHPVHKVRACKVEPAHDKPE